MKYLLMQNWELVITGLKRIRRRKTKDIRHKTKDLVLGFGGFDFIRLLIKFFVKN